VPLHADREAPVGHLERLDDPVVRHRRDPQPAADPVHRLVVLRADLGAAAEHAAGDRSDGRVDRMLRAVVAADVLIQGAAVCDVQQLVPAADADDRHVLGERGAQRGQVAAVAVQVQIAQRGDLRLAIQSRVDVDRRAGDDQPVGGGELPLEALAVEHARLAARAADPGLVGLGVLDRRGQHQDERALARRDLLVRGGQCAAGPGHALARGVLGDVEQPADLGQRQPALEAEQEQQPLVRGQAIECLPGSQPGVGIGIGGGSDRLVGELDVVMDAAAPEVIDRQVPGGAVDPCAQMVARSVPRGARPSPGKCLLTEVLGGARVAHHALQALRQRAVQLVEEVDHRHLPLQRTRLRKPDYSQPDFLKYAYSDAHAPAISATAMG
jgi:hypothetical protein